MIRLGVVAVVLAVASGGAVGNEAHEILLKMSPERRATYFAGYMRRSGEHCPSVSPMFFQGLDRQRTANWNVQCARGGKAWVISIRNDADGSTRLLECGVLKAVANVDCFVKLR